MERPLNVSDNDLQSGFQLYKFLSPTFGDRVKKASSGVVYFDPQKADLKKGQATHDLPIGPNWMTKIF